MSVPQPCDGDGARAPAIPDKAVVDFAWAVAQSTPRAEWTADYASLTPIMFEFSGMKEHVDAVRWKLEESEVYITASSARGEYPHVEYNVSLEVWLTFDTGMPDADVRLMVMH